MLLLQFWLLVFANQVVLECGWHINQDPKFHHVPSFLCLCWSPLSSRAITIKPPALQMTPPTLHMDSSPSCSLTDFHPPDLLPPVTSAPLHICTLQSCIRHFFCCCWYLWNSFCCQYWCFTYCCYTAPQFTVHSAIAFPPSTLLYSVCSSFCVLIVLHSSHTVVYLHLCTVILYYCCCVASWHFAPVYSSYIKEWQWNPTWLDLTFSGSFPPPKKCM